MSAIASDIEAATAVEGLAAGRVTGGPTTPISKTGAKRVRASHIGGTCARTRSSVQVFAIRAFGIDVLACPHCGGRLCLIATLHDPAVIRKILEHLDLSHSGQSPGPGPPASGVAAS